MKKKPRFAISDSAAVTDGLAGEPFATDSAEGTSALCIIGGFDVYFDHCRNPQYYGAVKSADLETWQDISSQISFPRGVRHGTGIQVPAAIVSNLQGFKTKKTNN